MSFSFVDVYYMLDASSARLCPNRERMSRRVHQPELRIEAKRLRFIGNHPMGKAAIDLLVSSTCTFTQNESLSKCVIFVSSLLLRERKEDVSLTAPTRTT
ncbi:unnamed protein product [Protopolystoma xenopodis]|uniref:Uncharacterized protein n=1 Tax=Protopolystoma xenopodis TaxID=117903 RepID=A0A448WVR7_9PLAT|nr:unnamed protein product [Protopolystoma xenopodis]